MRRDKPGGSLSLPIIPELLPMRIVILHQAITDQDTIEDRDVLVQVETVSQALRQLGHKTFALPCTLNLESMLCQIRALQPELVFNLVESLGGCDSLVYLSHAVLDSAGIPYTGNRTESHFLTAHKLLAKEQLHYAGLPTAMWIEEGARLVLGHVSLIENDFQSMDNDRCLTVNENPTSAKWIIKGVWDQASRDLDEESVIVGTREEVSEALRERIRRTHRPSFAEQFIEGREFNVSLLTGATGVEVLPPAEIDFSAFPPEKPRIVGHRAKWQEDSFEYQNTPRTFDFPDSDGPLLEELKSLAKQCWSLFSLHGWVRVDFRVDADGQPWILEINTNPCLSPDAGFAAALARAGIPFENAIRRIVEEV
jgi:D-alanine-D-alanine ligase